MSIRKRRSKEEEEKIDVEFTSLLKFFKPKFGNEFDINLAKKIGKAFIYERLMKSNKGTKDETKYKTWMYERKKNLIHSLNYYIKKNQL